MSYIKATATVSRKQGRTTNYTYNGVKELIDSCLDWKDVVRECKTLLTKSGCVESPEFSLESENSLAVITVRATLTDDKPETIATAREALERSINELIGTVGESNRNTVYLESERPAFYTSETPFETVTK